MLVEALFIAQSWCVIPSAFACYTPAAKVGFDAKINATGVGPALSRDRKTHEVSNE